MISIHGSLPCLQVRYVVLFLVLSGSEHTLGQQQDSGWAVQGWKIHVEAADSGPGGVRILQENVGHWCSLGRGTWNRKASSGRQFVF